MSRLKIRRRQTEIHSDQICQQITDNHCHRIQHQQGKLPMPPDEPVNAVHETAPFCQRIYFPSADNLRSDKMIITSFNMIINALFPFNFFHLYLSPYIGRISRNLSVIDRISLIFHHRFNRYQKKLSFSINSEFS